MTNSLTVSTTGYWPRIYFFQYRAVVTGWQLTANRISAAGDLRGWHQLAGVVLIQLDAVVCGCAHDCISVVKFFLALFYIRLPSIVTIFSDICLNQAHVLKAQNNAVNYRYLHKINNISSNNYFPLTNIIWSCGYQNHWPFPINDDFLESCQAKDDFSLCWHNVWFSYFLRTREGYMPAITESRLDHCRDNPSQACLSGIASDRDRNEILL